MNKLSDHLHTHFDGKQILILGWGREGKSTAATLRAACPTATLFVSDERPLADEDIDAQIQQTPYLKQLDRFDVIFKSPGIPVSLPTLKNYQQQGGVITSQLNEFLAVYRQQSIGVTGTKGKSTTSSLIAHVLTHCGELTLLAGNIGQPVFTIAPEITPAHTLVLEMSSYQLESAQHSPHRALFLNLFPEHLNYHGTIDQYQRAKAHITLHQNTTDHFFYNADDPVARAVAEASPATCHPFSYVDNQHADLIAQLQTLPATVRTWNVLPALCVTLSLGVKLECAREALTSFRALPHRMQTVSTAGGRLWIDDTLATIPQATVAALQALPQVGVLLLGGYDRGISYQAVADAVVARRIKSLVFFSPSGEIIRALIAAQTNNHYRPHMHSAQSMEDAVRWCYANSKEGETILLSPSSPSFGQFRDYEDKAAQFLYWIKELEPR